MDITRFIRQGIHTEFLFMQIQRLGYDYYDNDPDPSPGLFSSHGTSVAGVVGMAKGNGICGVGVAYDASITGETIESFTRWFEHGLCAGHVVCVEMLRCE